MARDDDRRSRRLSPMELACLRLLAAGATNKEIARRLTISPTTVASYLKSIYQKLGVQNRTHAIVVALRQGLLDDFGMPDP